MERTCTSLAKIAALALAGIAALGCDPRGTVPDAGPAASDAGAPRPDATVPRGVAPAWAPPPHAVGAGGSVFPAWFNGTPVGSSPLFNLGNCPGGAYGSTDAGDGGYGFGCVEAGGGSFPAGSNIDWVTKGGADSATCGSISAPCLTIAQAMSNITTASASNLWTIALGPGTYTENIVQKDSVNIVGQSFENTSIVGNLSLAAGFTAGNDAGLTGVNLVGSTCTFNTTAHNWNYIFFNDIVTCDVSAQLGSSLNFYYVSWVPVSTGMSVTDMSETITSQASFFDNGATITLTASTEAWDWESFSDAFSCPVKVVGTGSHAMSFVMSDNMGVGAVTIDGANAFWSGNVLAWPASPITFQGGADWVTNVQPGLSSQLAGLIPGGLGQVATTLDAGGGGLMVGWADAATTSVTGTGVWYSASGTLNSAAVTPSGDVSVAALSGSNYPFTVTGLQGRSVSSSAPTTGNTLGWTGTAWAPSAVNLAGGSGYVTGTLPLANMASPTGTGFVYDTSGTINSAAVGLSQDLSAAALSGGNVPISVVQLTGASSAVNVVSGTALDFLTSGHTTSAGGRINFPADVASNLIEYHYGGVDYVALNTDGGGNLFLGVGTLPQIIVDAATDAEITAAGSTLFVGGTGVYASSNFLVGATSFDLGGGTGGIVDIAPVGTTPPNLPTSHVGLYATVGQRLGVNGEGILFGAGITSTVQMTGTQPPAVSTGNGTAAQNFLYASVGGGATSAAAATGGVGGNTVLQSGGGGNATGTGATTGGAAGDVILNANGGGTGATAGAAGFARVRLNGNDTVVVGLQSTSTGTDNFTAIERAGSPRWLMGSVVGATTWAALYGPVTPSPTNHALLNDGTNTGLNSTGQTRLSSSGTAEAFADASGVTIGNGTTADYGGLVGGLSLGVAGTTPTGLPTSAIGLYATSGQRLGINGTGITWPAISTGLITIQQLTLASTSAGSGAVGAELDVVAQPGQPATGASNAGGTGGVSKYQSGAGGSSSLAAGGAGGIGYHGAGNGGNATGGTGAGGTGGDGIFYSGAGGTSSGGTAGSAGAVHIRVGGQTAGNDVLLMLGGLSTSTGQGSGLGAQFANYAMPAAGGTPTYAVTQMPIIKLGAATTSSGATLTLPNQVGMWWVDISALTLTNALTIKSGTGTCGTSITSLSATAQVVQVFTYGSNTCSLNQ
jgi:hypothetical protein